MQDAGESVKERSPQVFVVDSQVFPHHTPVRRDVPRLQLLHLLLAVALLGVLIEAGCICHLYSRHTPLSSDIQKVEYIKGEKDGSAHDSNEILPGTTPKAESTPVTKAESKPVSKAESKPAAFLQSDSAASGGNGVLGWKTHGFPMFMKGMDYKNNSLYIQQDGYYYIFSKIAHLENCRFFQHKVMQCTHSYSYKPMELMQNSRFLCESDTHQSDKHQSSGNRGNSYLGGIFHLNEGDSVFVMVNNSSLVLHNTYEVFFGAFMV
ncbi:tumor necrosis factor ligand superfamily member 14 [Siphateles boraxobius]|uniref:tumor necrosis factor ligand superfamily member 14 n=1 Tax=Siphateles boraxobius TaxID=180520 RepID=UPI0040642159